MVFANPCKFLNRSILWSIILYFYFLLTFEYTLDKENPEIYDCPNHISTFANRNKKPVIVNWEKPKAKDNSNVVKLKQTVGQTSGSSFSVGKTEIRYQAIDGSGNKSPYCIFWVDVEGMLILVFKRQYMYGTSQMFYVDDIHFMMIRLHYMLIFQHYMVILRHFMMLF